MTRICLVVKLFKIHKKFHKKKQLFSEKWRILLDFALLQMFWTSVSGNKKTKKAALLWKKARSRAAKVGKGLSKDEKAQILQLQHWYEALDPLHRYGLRFYHDFWSKCKSKQSFFYWLDAGEGKKVNLEGDCPRSKLQKQCIKYLGPREREVFEVMFEDGRFLYKMSRRLIDTSTSPEDTKWIFVLSTRQILYIGQVNFDSPNHCVFFSRRFRYKIFWSMQKRKGVFQHSSFLAGGAVLAAGRLVIERGILKTVCRDSGHYRPVKETIHEFRNFLERNNVDLSQLNIGCIEDDMEIPNGKKHLENIEAEPKGVYSQGECKEMHSVGTILDRNEKKAKRSSQMEDCLKSSKKLKIENNEDN